MKSEDYGIKFESIAVAKLSGLEKDSINSARRLYNSKRDKPVKKMEFYKILLVDGANRILYGGEQ